MTDCQNIFVNAAPSASFIPNLEHIHPTDPEYVKKWNQYVAKTRIQMQELEKEMQNPCYSAEEREHNLMLLGIAKRDWVILEEVMDMGVRVEKKMDESRRLDRQIAMLLERKANLEEEIAVKVEVLKDAHRRFGSERATYIEEAIQRKAEERKNHGFRGKLQKAKSLFSLRGRQ
ncbi:hypothetical protein HYALB_00008573 [Hymenoscyphus albidus]|uniref:Uncharacterized protein n=1 Tax=Hymenoscyphus albidus TaxID=595503 RepID=A0A9N9Q3P9_9HELO|nr:hypothetical protein HYALB_00008573 [Hymenoscyphus albidus]